MTADAPTIPRRPPADRPWRRRLIAFGLAVGIHGLIFAVAWPFVRQWVNTGGYDNPARQGPARQGSVTRNDLERVMADSPLISGLISSSPTAADLVAAEELTSDAWAANPPPALEHSSLPFAPQPWLAYAPPVSTLSFDLPPAARPSSAR